MPSFLKRNISMFYQNHTAKGMNLWTFIATLAAFFIPMEAMADASGTLGAIVCNIRNSGSGVPNLLASIAYIIGAILLVRGVLALKKNADNPSQVSPAIGIAMLVAGGAVITLPSLGGYIQETLFSEVSDGGLSTCVGGSVASNATSLDLMMINFVGNLHQPIFNLVALLAFIVGLTYLVAGVLRMAKTGTDARASNPKDVIIYLIIGGVLISLSSVLPLMLSTVFGSDTDSISKMSSFQGISWSGIVGDGATTDAADAVVIAILKFIQIIGIIAFFRGWMIVKKAVEGGQATIPQGVTHIIGGAMAINMDKMLEVLDKTFGTGLING